jgi:hypothetical protein
VAGLRAQKAVAAGEACAPADLAEADSAAVAEDSVAGDFAGNEEVEGMEECVCCA